MGEIHKSVDDSGRPIALKTILQEHQGDQTFRDLFIREAEVTFQLDHPNIVRAYRFDHLGRQLVLALEYLEGVNVKDILREVYARKLMIPVPIAVAIMQRVLYGLHYAHSKKDSRGNELGIIHRDLNPSNVFVTYTGEVKILDFGISKATQKEVHQLTPFGELRGKMCYLSPEQVRGTDIDARSDIFTAGIVFWEILTGRPLYLRKSDQEVMEAIGRAEYEPISSLRSDIPDGLERAIQRALTSKSNSRYKTALDFAHALDEVMEPYRVPGIGEEDIGIFVRALFNRGASESDPHFLSGYAWLMTQLPGRREAGLELLNKLIETHAQRPYVLLNYARAHLQYGDRALGLRAMRRMARSDSYQEEAQRILEWLGVRRRPVFGFLSRSHPINYLVGKVRHSLQGPTRYQAEFLAA
jgi:serine/threonine protein kinase